MPRIRASTLSRVSESSARTESFSVAVSGITLGALPAWIAPTVTTAARVGSMLRATIDCKASTILAAATIGSQPNCGIAPCVPLPVTVIVTESDDAIMQPWRSAKWPTGKPGALCNANTWSHGKRVKRPSAIIFEAPPRPSSAGWKITFSVPSNSPLRAR